MPPRHGKSNLVSEWFPVWYLGLWSDDRVILASYEADFASTWGRKVRDHVNEFGPTHFGISVSEDSFAKDRWDLVNAAGGMMTAGAGGPITGKGADLFIIDDPVKNDEQALSETFRKHQWDWMLSTALSRIEPNGVMVVIMTHWHGDDLGGRIERGDLEHDPDHKEPWTILKMPALAIENEPAWPLGIGRKVGEPLWPERWPESELQRMRSERTDIHTGGAYWWSALYQQDPQPDQGNIIKREWFRYYTVEERDEVDRRGRPVLPPKGETDIPQADNFLLHQAEGEPLELQCDLSTRFATIDLAVSTKDSADYTVIAIWSMLLGKYLVLLDLWRERWTGPQQIDAMHRAKEQFDLDFVAVETVGYQLAAVQHARRSGLTVRELKAGKKDKVARALSLSAKMEKQEVYFNGHAPYLATLESELLGFPNAPHDDITDALTYGAIQVSTMLQPRIRRI